MALVKSATSPGSKVVYPDVYWSIDVDDVNYRARRRTVTLRAYLSGDAKRAGAGPITDLPQCVYTFANDDFAAVADQGRPEIYRRIRLALDALRPGVKAASIVDRNEAGVIVGHHDGFIGPDGNELPAADALTSYFADAKDA